MKGKRKLRFSSILQIIIGVLTILLVRILLKEDQNVTILNKELLEDALWGLFMVYGIAVIRILAGIIGFVRANHKSIFTIIFGIILVLCQASEFMVGEMTTTAMIVDGVLLLIPLLYLVGAIQNFKSESKEK